nr:MAG TPA: hypothetical protein [Caudoviricetes sp.]
MILNKRKEIEGFSPSISFLLFNHFFTISTL